VREGHRRAVGDNRKALDESVLICEIRRPSTFDAAEGSTVGEPNAPFDDAVKVTRDTAPEVRTPR
jgi:hypothetical protein